MGNTCNLMACPHELPSVTILLKGSVKIVRNHKEVFLKPGQAAFAKVNLNDLNVKDVDTASAIAWKQGYFKFDNENLVSIMKKIARWYDVDVEYKGNIPMRKFTGDISRDVNLSELLKLFQVNKIHFQVDVENKKIIVMP